MLLPLSELLLLVSRLLLPEPYELPVEPLDDEGLELLEPEVELPAPPDWAVANPAVARKATTAAKEAKRRC